MAEVAYDKLKQQIRSRELEPARPTPEPELGINRSAVREALVRLESEGLVELIPRRGADIHPLTLEDMREIYEALSYIEPEIAAKVAAQEFSPEQHYPLEVATRRMESAAETNSIGSWADADDAFHLALLD